MIVCQKCSAENADGSQYCDECGTSLGRTATAPHTSFISQHAADFAPQASNFAVKGNESDGNGNSSFDGRESSRVQDDEMPRNSAAPIGSLVNSDNVGAKNDSAKLIIQRGRSTGKEFQLETDEMHIGRWDADGGIFPDVDLDSDDPEAKVSRRHARIVRRNNQYFIEDLGSTNGTFVNRGRRLLPGDLQPLSDGDEIIVGKTFLRFHIVDK